MKLKKNLFLRFLRPAGDGKDLPGGTGGGSSGATGSKGNEDYGDDFTPTGDDADDAGAGQSSGAGRQADPDDGAADDTSKGKSKGEGEGDDGGDDKGGLESGADALGEGEGDGKKDTGTPKTGKGKFIPLDRHEKLLKKERARREELETQLTQSRAGQQMAQANDKLEKIESELVGMEKQYNKLLAEGDTDGAADVMTKIRHKNAELNSITFQQREAEMTARAVEQARYKEALSRVEEAYPQLDPDSDEFDSDLLQDVSDLMTSGIQRGLPPTKALQRAVQRVVGVDDSAQKQATTTTPRVNEEEIAAQRRKDAVKRNLDAAGRTPPATHRAGAGNDAAGGAMTAKQVMAMSDEEFNKLSDKDLAKLRGDTM